MRPGGLQRKNPKVAAHIFGKNRRRNGAGKFAPGMKKQLLFLSLPRVDIAEEVIKRYLVLRQRWIRYILNLISPTQILIG